MSELKPVRSRDAEGKYVWKFVEETEVKPSEEETKVIDEEIEKLDSVKEVKPKKRGRPRKIF